MNRLIIVTPEELRRMLEEIIDLKYKQPIEKEKKYSENLSLAEAVEFLKDNGFPTSKAQIYKLTSINQMPHSKYGNKLLFTRKNLLTWANGRTTNVTDLSERMLEVARSANNKRRKY